MTHPDRPIRIVVADDHHLMRDLLAMTLRRCPTFEVVAVAADGMEALTLARKLRPDLAILDLRMPILDGPEVVARLAGEVPEMKFLVLTSYETDQDVDRALKAGAHGYALKGNTRYEELVEIVKDVVLRGVRRVPETLIERAERRKLGDELSSRELTVLRLLASGCTNAQIAEKLSISDHTVKNHITNILAKLGVDSRTQAIVVGVQRGWVQMG